MRNVLLVLTLMLSVRSYAAEPTVIRILGVQSAAEASVGYYHELLARALELTEAEYGKAQLQVLTPPPLGNYRFLLQRQDYIDVQHFGTEASLEKDLLPVRVPLLAGGLGWRGMIIRKADAKAFRQISKFSQLRRLIACSGTLWPDSRIMRTSGMQVLTAERHDQLLELLARGRCDYFPRSIFEGPIEQRAFKKQYPGLEYSTDLLLHYPFAMYYFVRKTNPQLAERLSKGLEIMVQSNELQQRLFQHDIAKDLQPLTKFANSLVFELENPLLPAQTPINDARYWFDLPVTNRVTVKALEP